LKSEAASPILKSELRRAEARVQMPDDREYYTQEELQSLFGVTYYKIKEAMDRLTASGEIEVETKALDRRKKYIHKRYVPKFREYFGL
jgi:hypothetical protein